MRFSPHLSCLLLPLSLSAAADTTSYQTAPKPDTTTQSKTSWSTPLISVAPVTGKTRVYIQPDGSFSNSLASNSAPIYHARVLYEPTPQGITTSQLILYREMRDTCPQGWIKLQEWVHINQEIASLNYQFQCLYQANKTSE